MSLADIDRRLTAAEIPLHSRIALKLSMHRVGLIAD
jgi:hypothetical protein